MNSKALPVVFQVEVVVSPYPMLRGALAVGAATSPFSSVLQQH